MNEDILIFGLDGLSWELINKCIQNFQTPNIKSWASNGFSCKMLTTIPSRTYVAVPSLITGSHPPNLYQANKLQNSIINNYSQIQKKSFWEFTQKKNCIVNLRCTYKPRPFNGIMVAGDLFTPSNDSDYTYPKKIKEGLKDFHKNINNKPLEGGKEKYYNNLKNDTIKKLNYFKDLISKETYGISLFWDGNLDYIQHYLWKEKSYIRKYLELLDNIFGDIFKKTSAKNILLLSDHGFDSPPKYNLNLHTWLIKEKYMYLKGSQLINAVIGRISLVLHQILQKNDFIFKKIQNVTSNKSTNFPFSKKYPVINYKKTKAQLSTGWWGIELNANLLNEKEYHELRIELIRKLKKIEHDGARIIKEIYTSEEIYGDSSYGKKTPDLYILTYPQYICHHPITSKIITFRKNNQVREGIHDNSRDAFLLAYGPNIISQSSISVVNIVDIAPTIIHMLGGAIPQYMDGIVIKEIFRKDSEPAKREIKYCNYEKEKQNLNKKIRNLKLTGKI